MFNFKKNIFLKSTIRKPLQSLVLIMLVGTAAFAFVMRSTEFLMIRDSVSEAAAHYRSIGFLQVPGEAYANVISGADVISSSRYVDFEDRRRGAEAVLHDLQNINMMGRPGGGSVLHGAEVAYVSIPERHHYAYFYAILDRVSETNHEITGHFIELRVTVEDVVVSFPEHAIAGQEARLRLHLDGAENPLTDMEIGERYFMRAALYWSSTHGRGVRHNFPIVGQALDILYMHALNDSGLMYIPVPYGRADLTQPQFEGIAADIERMHYNHSVVWLRTTSDMTAMPIMMEEFDRVDLVQGRFLDRYDYLEARPVAVVHHTFAQMRGLSIGDTITVSVPEEQQIVDLHVVAHLGGRDAGGIRYRMENFVFTDGMMDFAVLGNHAGEMVTELELEIVGTYTKLATATMMRDLHMGMVNPTLSALFGNYIYIPDSLLPAGLMAVDNMHGYSDYVWSNWYSFVLSDTRNEAAFLAENSDLLEAMGYNLVLIPSGAENFWASATPILRSVNFNAITFLIVLIMVLCLVTFIFLHQKRREFAIMRALGNPASLSVRQLCVPLAVICLPAIIIGGLFGWTFALEEAAASIGFLHLDSEAYYAGYSVSINISILWLLLQLSAIFAIMILALYIGARRTAKLPVLALLQGRSGKPEKALAGASASLSFSGVIENEPSLIGNVGAISNRVVEDDREILTSHGATQTNRQSKTGFAVFFTKLLGSARFIIRHIVRAPVKTVLTLIVAAFLISALGVLQWSIRDTESEINRLYDTTVVSGELQRAAVVGGGNVEPVIFRNTVDMLLGQDIFLSYYLEATFWQSYVIPAEPDGSFPTGVEGDFWDDLWRYIRTTYWGDRSARENPILAFSDFDNFVDEQNRLLDDTPPGILDPGIADFGDLGVAAGPLEVEFGAGFGQGDFVYLDQSLVVPIPVILSDLTLERRGLSVGDVAFIGHNTVGGQRARRAFEVPIVIIGQHNGNISQTVGRNAVLMPLAALEFLRGDMLEYIAFRFEVEPAVNRELGEIRAELQERMRRHRQSGAYALDFYLHDSELQVVADLEQNLQLLELLYPVAVGISVLIGIGLAVLLLLQSAKIAAILRILGFGKKHTRAIVCLEHIIVSLIGLIIGLVILTFAHFGVSAPLPALAALYLSAVITGAAIGSFIMTRRAPLELLQVKE